MQVCQSGKQEAEIILDDSSSRKGLHIRRSAYETIGNLREQKSGTIRSKDTPLQQQSRGQDYSFWTPGTTTIICKHQQSHNQDTEMLNTTASLFLILSRTWPASICRNRTVASCSLLPSRFPTSMQYTSRTLLHTAVWRKAFQPLQLERGQNGGWENQVTFTTAGKYLTQCLLNSSYITDAFGIQMQHSTFNPAVSALVSQSSFDKLIFNDTQTTEGLFLPQDLKLALLAWEALLILLRLLSELSDHKS